MSRFSEHIARLGDSVHADQALSSWLRDHTPQETDLPSRTRIDQADFFQYKGAQGGYDVIYDYT